MLTVFVVSASVIGLYTSYTVPIFLVVIGGMNKVVPGPFTLGKWSRFIGAIAVSWVIFIIVLLVFPPDQHITAETMSACGPIPLLVLPDLS